MKKLLILASLILALTACSQKSSTTDGANTEGNATSEQGADSQGNSVDYSSEEMLHSTYAGQIDGKIEATVDIHRMDRIARGTITYKSSGKPILVLGTIEENGTFFLREYQPDGLVTGVMSGEMKGDQMTGSWFGTGKDQELSLKMTRTQAQPEDEFPYELSGSVAGEYGYHYPPVGEDPGAAGTAIVKLSGDQILFSFDCVNGPPGYHMASLEETEGILEGSEVEFTIPDFNCNFLIRFFEGFLVVEAIDASDDCGFGMGATIEGEFVKLR